MSNNKVNGKATSRPAGYDSFDEKKELVNRTTQLQHGEEKGFNSPKHEKVVIGGLFKAIREFKEQGKTLENVVRIKAQTTVQQVER